MKISDVTCDALLQAVAFAMAECEAQLKQSSGAISSALSRDLNVALSALRVIDAELKSGLARPERQRSAAFIRYMIDGEPTMEMKDELRRLIVEEFTGSGR